MLPLSVVPQCDIPPSTPSTNALTLQPWHELDPGRLSDVQQGMRNDGLALRQHHIVKHVMSVLWKSTKSSALYQNPLDPAFNIPPCHRF